MQLTRREKKHSFHLHHPASAFVPGTSAGSKSYRRTPACYFLLLLLFIGFLAGCSASAPTSSTLTPISSHPAGLTPSPTRVLKGTISEFPLPRSQSSQSIPVSITAGPDGNLWFTEVVSGLGRPGGKIGRMTPTGTISEFSLPNSETNSITAGPDGNLWFTEVVGGPSDLSGKIGRMTPTGAISEFPLPHAVSSIHAPDCITAGPDGNLWFTEAVGEPGGTSGKIGRITPTGTVNEFSLPPHNATLGCITAGPDGNLWFTEMVIGPGGQRTRIGRITPAGMVSEFPLLTPTVLSGSITAGPDGNLWFTEAVSGPSGQSGKIGRITPTGTISEFPLSNSQLVPFSITAGPDGNLWFTEAVSGPGAGGLNGKIGRITPTGTISEFPLPTPNSVPYGITRGPDGTLWCTVVVNNQNGRIDHLI